MPALLIHSSYGATPAPLGPAIASGQIRAVCDIALTDTAFDSVSGIILTQHLDQIGFLDHRAAIMHLLKRGGRLFFNGHLIKPFLPDLTLFAPLPSPKRADFGLTRLADHTVFGDIDPARLVTRKGVAGFYGRGHMPLPPGAQAITGLGPKLLPIDWLWNPPLGGQIFAHAGNDLWGTADDRATNFQLAQQIANWVCPP